MTATVALRALLLSWSVIWLGAPTSAARDVASARHEQRPRLSLSAVDGLPDHHYVVDPAAFGSSDPFATPEAHGSWLRRASMPVAKDDFAYAETDGRIYAFGGMTGPRGTLLDDAEVYDVVSDTWRMLPDLPTRRRSVRAAAVGATIYVVGGVGVTGPTGTVEAFDTQTGAWSTRAAMPTPRYGMAIAVVDGVLYAIGGFRDGRALATVERYDPLTDRWQPRAPLTTPRTHLAAVGVGATIYALGGEADHGPLDVTEVYEAAADRWHAGPSLPEPLSNFSAVLVDGRIHVLEHDVHDVLRLVDQRWSHAVPMPTPRHGLGLVAIDGVIFAFGGCHQQLFDLDVVEAYDANAGPVGHDATIPAAN
jgi:hypothetical protein